MRGASFVVGEIVLWMAAATVVGILIGWVVRGWRNARVDAEWLVLVTSLRDRITNLEDGADNSAPEGRDLDDAATLDDVPGEPDPRPQEGEDHVTERQVDDGPTTEDVEAGEGPQSEAAQPVEADAEDGSSDHDDRPPIEDSADGAEAVVIDLTDTAVGPADPFTTSDDADVAPVGGDDAEPR